MGQTLQVSIANRIAELPPLAAAIGQFLRQLQVASEAIDAVQLALDELIANEILWGKHTGACEIQVQTIVERDCVRVAIESPGAPFDPRAVPAPNLQVPLENRREGGLGLYLVRAVVDKLDHDYRDGRNRLDFSVARR